MSDGGPSNPSPDDPTAMEGIDIDILEDGTVRLHATCQPGQNPEECAARVEFLVEALGIPLEGVVTEISPPARETNA